jgi:vesicle coat complex subunit
LEFKEYATEVDVDFVRKAVRAIGRCAIKLERAAERCISVLLELIKIKVNYVVQEAIIVIKDIFRRYPNTYCHLSLSVLGVDEDRKVGD